MKYYSTSDLGIWILHKNNNDGTAYFYEDFTHIGYFHPIKPEYRLYKFYWVCMRNY